MSVGNTAGSLDAATRRWLEWEQRVNDRLANPAVHTPIDYDRLPIDRAFRPEARRVWPQEVVWLPRSHAQTYGDLDDELTEVFGPGLRRPHVPLLLHPQPPAAHRRLAQQFGRAPFFDVSATATSSLRSLVAWRPGRRAAVLKLSLGMVIGRVRRAVRENQVARATLVSSVLDTVPRAHTAALGLDWCREPAGMVETESRHGWILRRLPSRLVVGRDETMMPMFSLISRRGREASYLASLIRASGRRPETFVIDAIVTPYVEALAYLVFVQGIHAEAHVQNTLVVLDAEGQLTGRLVLRDLSDMSVNVPLRLVRRLPLPRPAAHRLPARSPFMLASLATDEACNFGRATMFRAFDTVERYGFWSVLWAMNAALTRDLKGYRASTVERAYLERWQAACERYLGVTPLFRQDRGGIATDEAVAYFLSHVDWTRLGLARRQRLPDEVQATRIGGPVRRRPGRVYDRVDGEWGDLYLEAGRPVFFRPAF